MSSNADGVMPASLTARTATPAVSSDGKRPATVMGALGKLRRRTVISVTMHFR